MKTTSINISALLQRHISGTISILALALCMASFQNAVAQKSPSIDETVKFIVSKMDGYWMTYKSERHVAGFTTVSTQYFRYTITYDKTSNTFLYTQTMEIHGKSYRNNRPLPPLPKTGPEKRSYKFGPFVSSQGKMQYPYDSLKVKHLREDSLGAIQNGGIYQCGPFYFASEDADLAERISKALNHWYQLLGIKKDPF